MACCRGSGEEDLLDIAAHVNDLQAETLSRTFTSLRVRTGDSVRYVDLESTHTIRLQVPNARYLPTVPTPNQSYDSQNRNCKCPTFG